MNDLLNIDWNPGPIEYKERLLQIIMNRLCETYNKYSSIHEFCRFYEQRAQKELL